MLFVFVKFTNHDEMGNFNDLTLYRNAYLSPHRRDVSGIAVLHTRKE